MNSQDNIHISGDKNKVIGGDDKSTNIEYHLHSAKQTRLSLLFDKLKEEFDKGNTITDISNDLARYTDKRDTIGLEQKLIDGNREHLFQDFRWLKQEYYKKLTTYQFYEPAQEIHSFILGIVFERFRNIIYPMIRNNNSEQDILNAISNQIVNPIVMLIQQQGCSDIMKLGSTEIEGMIHFLTGRCHLKWNL